MSATRRSLVLTLTLSLGACASNPSAPVVSHEPAAAAPTETPSEPLTLRYATAAGQFRHQGEVVSVVQHPDHQQERSLTFGATVERGPGGATLAWELYGEPVFAPTPDVVLERISGEFLLDDRGNRSTPPAADRFLSHSEEVLSLAVAGLSWPPLPEDALLPDEPLQVREIQRITLADVQLDVHREIVYTLTDVQPEQGTATLEIKAQARGQTEREGQPLTVAQSTETTVVLALDDGVPRRWTSVTEQRFALDDHEITFSQSVDSELTPRG